MMPRRPAGAIPALLVALAVVLTACGDDDDEAPSEATTPPSPGALPPELLDCFADQGIDVDSPDELHAAPPEIVQRCFTELHEGGA